MKPPTYRPPERRCESCDATAAGCANSRMFSGRDCCPACHHLTEETP